MSKGDPKYLPLPLPIHIYIGQFFSDSINEKGHATTLNIYPEHVAKSCS